MKIGQIALALFLFLVTIPHTVEADHLEHQQIMNGVLDLRTSTLNDKIINLNGDWEFYWNQLLTPENFRLGGSRTKEYIEAPSIWSKAVYTGDTKLSNEGYGTYRMRIRISDKETDKLMALYLPPVATTYKLWVNGELLAQNGTVGKSRASTKPKSYSQVASFLPKANEIEIIMQVSNFSLRKGGMWSSIKFGYNHEISGQREQNILHQIITASALLALSFYLISLYLFRAITKLPLFLGILCLIISVRTLLVGDVLLIYLFPMFPWEWSIKLEYLTSYVGFIVVFVFLYYLFPNEMNKKMVTFSVVICSMFGLTTLFPARIFTHFLETFQGFLFMMFFYCIYVVTLAMIHKREGAKLNFLSLIFMVMAVVNDILYYNSWINSTDLTPIFCSIFLFVQTLIVAKKSSAAFSEVEKLSKEIQRTNELLEERVADRTRDLLEINNQLRHIENTRKAFFSTVAHEIRTPMQSIQGYIQLIQNGFQPEEQEKYLKIVDEKVKLLTRLSKDLLDLAKMDEEQFHFIYEEVDTHYLFEHLCNRFKFDIEAAGLNGQFSSLDIIPKDYYLLVEIDVIRIEQVISNILSNAIKFTSPGGTISMTSEYLASAFHNVSEKENGYFNITISDTGAGIETELIPHIFDRFVKGKDALTRKKGSGLGLAICYEIIKRHRGTISVESELGKGSRFTISLPAKMIIRGNFT